MANIGIGETRDAYLIKPNKITEVDSQIKEIVPHEQLITIEGVAHFKYRYLSQSEMTYHPLSAWLKGKQDRVIFTSETTLEFKERDYILLDDGRKLRITRQLPQSQHGAFLFNKKPPHILELE